MSKKQVVILGITLILIGTIVMGLLRNNEYGHLIGGLIIGAGGGCMAVLTSPKKSEH